MQTATTSLPNIRETAFSNLGKEFVQTMVTQPISQAHWVCKNPNFAQLDLNLQTFSGNFDGIPKMASVYSGHQFGQWAGQLGDGRAALLGEMQLEGIWQEVQLKGAGYTEFSRGGDGRAVLRSSIREFLACEAMHALGIASTRALCLVGSMSLVRREQQETAAVLTRFAPSFVRFGHFEHFCHHGMHTQLRQLANFVIEKHYPNCQSAPNPYVSFLQQVIERTARMVAQWQAIGFCHGVMNTDNMGILGTTLDYGPFQFLDGFDAQHICNHSDTQGRYAFDQQPDVAHWNLFCLAQALLPLTQNKEETLAALSSYSSHYAQQFRLAMLKKIGLGVWILDEKQQQIDCLIAEITNTLQVKNTDYSRFWWMWTKASTSGDWKLVLDLFDDAHLQSAFLAWKDSVLSLKTNAHGNITHITPKSHPTPINPKYILRNHMAQEAIEKAELGDFSLVQNLLNILQSPFEEHPHMNKHSQPAPSWAKNICISCSS